MLTTELTQIAQPGEIELVVYVKKYIILFYNFNVFESIYYNYVIILHETFFYLMICIKLEV